MSHTKVQEQLVKNGVYTFTYHRRLRYGKFLRMEGSNALFSHDELGVEYPPVDQDRVIYRCYNPMDIERLNLVERLEDDNDASSDSTEQ